MMELNRPRRLYYLLKLLVCLKCNQTYYEQTSTKLKAYTFVVNTQYRYCCRCYHMHISHVVSQSIEILEADRPQTPERWSLSSYVDWSPGGFYSVSGLQHQLCCQDQDQVSILKSLAMSFPQFICSTLRLDSGMDKNPPEEPKSRWIVRPQSPVLSLWQSTGIKKAGQNLVRYSEQFLQVY